MMEGKMKLKYVYILAAAAAIILSVGGMSALKGESQPIRMFDLKTQQGLFITEVMPELSKNRIVLVGERHSEKTHHDGQLRVIQALHDAGVSVAIGFEMFEKTSQPALDKWVSGQMSAKDFQRVYYNNWNFPWPLYSDIFEYAKKMNIPMVGLNVSREITRRVAKEGFKSLSKAQRGMLSDVVCRVDEEYMQFIKDAFGAHAHGNLNFIYFCEAQLVWDTAMALNAISYLKNNPEKTMVIIAGSGHVRRGGIPKQIKDRSDLPHVIILPEVPGSIEPGKVDLKDADYLLPS
jgi:uncharacterized iron-regulated protein